MATPKISVDLGQVEIIVRNISNVTKAMAVSKSIQAGGEALRAEVKKNIGFNDHTLADLARLDHPYARRHGTIQYRRVGHARWQVHTQTGEMLGALTGTMSGGLNPAYRVTFDLGRAPHARNVIEGTKLMLPRDVIWVTGQQRSTKKAILQSVVRVLGAELRSQSFLRLKL